MKAYQQILRGFRSSERGIRYRILKGTFVDELRRNAAKYVAGLDLPDDARPEARRIAFQRAGVRAMLIAVTKEPVPRPALPPKVPGPVNEDGSSGPMVQPPAVEPPLADASLWQPVDAQTLSVAGPFTYEFDPETETGLFTAADDEFLRGLFSINHEVSLLAIDDVLKKELTVSTG